MFSTLAACAATSGDRSGEPSREQAAPEREAENDTRYDVFPNDVILSCPEPEPAPACPPPKPVKCPVCPKPEASGKVDGKMIVGAVESVRLSPPDMTYKARIDTGATGSSIHASDIVRFERDGESWVRFNLEAAEGESVALERKVVRSIRVRQAELEIAERRMVVLMTVTLGSLSQQLEMSLTDRSAMGFPVLIGRNFLRNNAIVDVSQEMIAK
ncbi:MAG: ATP-dependent zinc protease [Porticoccaceae bacterium]